MYQKRIQRKEPGLVVLVLDDSGSMSRALPTTSDAKFKWVERYTGQILQELLARSNEMQGDEIIIRPRYYLHTILYGNTQTLWPDEATIQRAGLEGLDPTAPLDIEQVIRLYTSGSATDEYSLGLGGHLGGTDARGAFDRAYELLSAAVATERFRHSFPPMLFHLTDGESASDAEPIAEQIKQLSTDDGNVLVVNAYIGTQTSLQYSGPGDFGGYRTEDEAGPKQDSIRLFRMSSPAPDAIRQNLIEDGIFPQLREGARLYFDVRTKEMLKHVIQAVGSQGSRYYQ